jgi:tetratricopeptide (TPR) repeat protein
MNPRYSAWIALALATAGTILPGGPVLAQTQQEWMLCQDLRSPDYPIQGCTAVIQAGRQILDRLAFAHNNRGVAYRLKAEYDKAIADFDEAIKLRPDYPNAFNNRGVAYRNKGDLDHAMADYDQSITLKPGCWTCRATFATSSRANIHRSCGISITSNNTMSTIRR